ncbi:MAG: helix-turn-helix domain-containing protein [Phycisphaerae bacterium]|nr:helix-turn-helix domain-containing protein [Phycisphaerae bacterium]
MSVPMGAVLPAYMTPADVATMLQVHERSVLRWAAADASMPVTRLGGRVVRFERAALLRWLERKQPRLARRSTHSAAQTAGDAA